MGFLDRLFGGSDERAAQPARQVPPARQLSEDELAIERYRYLLRTAPPESIEAVHAEAFAKLTPEQRAEVYRTLAEQAPPGERVVSDDGALIAAIDEALAAQPDVLAKIRDGKVQAAGAVIGAVMKAMHGKADAARVRELVLERASGDGA